MTRVTRPKKRRDQLIAWAERDPSVLLLWEDECWFSRFAQPRLKVWGQLTLQQRLLLPPTPYKALSYYGVKRHDGGQVYLYPCLKRPHSDETVQFLHWLTLNAELMHKRVIVVIWDNARWHTARKVKRWIRRYNHQVKGTSKPRLLVWALPKRSPWLNPIEPHWLHAKRKVCEPTSADLSPQLLQHRVFAALKARFIAFLSQPVL
jgi:transposase